MAETPKEEGDEVTLLEGTLEEEFIDKEGKRTVKTAGRWKISLSSTGVKILRKIS